MKSVVVIDTPETCKECLFNGFNWNVCILTDEDIDEYVNPNETKPEWCPLRQLPNKNKYKHDSMATVNYEDDITLADYQNFGWNACLD